MSSQFRSLNLAVVFFGFLAMMVNVFAQEATEEPVVEDDEYVYSDSESYVFFTEHLANIDTTGTLKYKFIKTGSLEEGFEDEVVMNVQKVNDNGYKHVKIDFFTGDRKQYVEPNENTNHNGVLLVFLQGDVYEMDRLTDGSWRYFHRRVKHGFHEVAELKNTQFTYNGTLVQGKKVVMQPFLNDPHRPDFEEYADKRYEFYFSEQVPGMLYKIVTIIPDMEKGEKAFEDPLLYESLELTEVNLGLM